MTTKKTFYVTFGQRNPLSNGWVEILASNMEEAVKEANIVFGEHYARVYEARHFDSSGKDAQQYFPEGRYGRVIEAL